VPSSCPKPGEVWETGASLIKNLIAKKKLSFGKYLQQQNDTELYKQVFEEQHKNN